MYEKRTGGWQKHIGFLLIDLLCVQAAFAAAYFIQFGFRNPYAREEYRILAVFYAAADLLVTISANSFQNVLRRENCREFLAAVKDAVLTGSVTVLLLFAAEGPAACSCGSFLIMMPIYILLSYLARQLQKRIVKRYLKRRRASTAAVVFAPYGDLPERIRSLTESGIRVVGAIAEAGCSHVGEKEANVPIMGDTANFEEALCQEWVDEAFLFFSPAACEELRLPDRLLDMGIVSHLALGQERGPGRCQTVEEIGGDAYLTVGMNFIDPLHLALKRCTDICGAVLGCGITLVIMAVFGPMIRRESPGPILYASTRIGRNGKKFRMYKLRTMYLDAEARKSELSADNRVKDGMMFKLDFDPRVIGNRILPDGRRKTGIGQFLRDTSLDEFPQMINILRGDMSLVGTRPPTPDEWEKYRPHHRARMAFRPGLTGMWQANGRSNITDFEEVVRLDTEYIRRWSLGLDIRILAKTIRNVLKKDGAM